MDSLLVYVCVCVYIYEYIYTHTSWAFSLQNAVLFPSFFAMTFYWLFYTYTTLGCMHA